MALFIGLMSGTSADGIDAALVDWHNPSAPKILATHLHAIPDSIRSAVHRLAQSGDDEIATMAELDNTLGQLFSDAVLELCAASGVTPVTVKAIGSHGQTIRHYPATANQAGFSLQIGDPNIIAERTGITTIADFRRRDIAAGGQGAPLAPALHRALFHSPAANRMIINLGGIANITWLPTDDEVIGFDTGPANGLMDSWCQQHIRQPFDRNGDWAKSGKVHRALLSQLLCHPFLPLPFPKSTGREAFNLVWLEEQLALIEKPIHPEDVQATLLAYTVETIASAIERFTGVTEEVYLCGGGAHNDLLREKLAKRLTPVKVNTTEVLGIHPDWVEAVAFSWLAKQMLEHQPGNLPSVTGAKKPVILGGIYLG